MSSSDFFLQEGQSLASNRGLYFTETSALSGEQVTELLQSIGKKKETLERFLLCFFTGSLTNNKY